MLLRELEEFAEVDAIVCPSKSYLKRLIVVFWKFVFCRKSKYDCVFVGFFAQPIMPLVRVFWRGPIIGDGFISLFDSLVLDKGLSRRDSLAAKLSLWLDRYLLKHSRVALVDTDQHRLLYQSFLREGEVGPCFHRIWAGADESDFPPLDELPYQLGSGERFEVLFWGGFIPLQGVDVIIRAAALLDPAKVRLTIVGHGQTYPDCRELADSLQAEAVVFEGWKTPAQLRELASRSHLLLGIFGSTEKAKRVIPNKAFQALALKKPLLTGRSIGIDELLKEDEDVLLCEMDDPEDLADGIEWVRTHYEIASGIAERGYETFQQNCSSAILEQQLRGVVDDVFQQ